MASAGSTAIAPAMPNKSDRGGNVFPMKLSQIRDVLAVAELGSLRAAGRHLGVGQPSITRSIRDIEHELGAALFERNSKGVHLTTIGAAFLRRAATVEQELRRAKEEVVQLKGGSIGQVSIAVSVAAGIALTPMVFQQFRKRYPEGLVRVTESLFQPVEADINEGRVDFYVGALDITVPRSSLSIEKLFGNTRVILARKGHRLVQARNLKELAKAEWIRPTLSPRSTEAEFDDMFTSLGLPAPRIVMHSRSALLTVLTVASSDLLTVGPQQWLEYTAFADRLQSITVVQSLEAVPVCLVRRSSMPLTPMAEHLCDLFRRAAEFYKSQRLKDSKALRA
jgi:LysR family transcriptional regulator of abg operon